MGVILRQSGFKDPQTLPATPFRFRKSNSCALKAVAKIEIGGFVCLFIYFLKKQPCHPYWGIYLQFHRTGGVPEVLNPCQTFQEGDGVGRDLVSSFPPSSELDTLVAFARNAEPAQGMDAAAAGAQGVTCLKQARLEVLRTKEKGRKRFGRIQHGTG